VSGRRPDVVVVGGGVIGLASAWRLAQQGVAVELADPAPGSGASGVAAGMLAPLTEARIGEEELLGLGMASLGRWPDFAAELEEASGRSVGFRTDGTIIVAFDGDDRARLADTIDRQRSLGLDVEDLPGRALRSVEPALAPSVRRGVWAAGERSVDPQALVEALLVAAERAGVSIVRRRVTSLLLAAPGYGATDVAAGSPGLGNGKAGSTGAAAGSPGLGNGKAESTGAAAGSPGLGNDKAGVANEADGDRVAGVRLDDGTTVAAGTVVLAAGAWSADVAGLPAEARPPVRPVKGQVLTLRQRPDDVLVRHVVRAFVRGSSVYLVPRNDGRLVCGATEEERGWDATPTAGAAYELLRDVLTLFPGLDEAELVGTTVGFRPGTPDALPRIGPSPSLEGLVLATGHFRNGILLTPLTADRVAASVVGEPAPGVGASTP